MEHDILVIIRGSVRSSHGDHYIPSFSVAETTIASVNFTDVSAEYTNGLIIVMVLKR